MHTSIVSDHAYCNTICKAIHGIVYVHVPFVLEFHSFQLVNYFIVLFSLRCSSTLVTNSPVNLLLNSTTSQSSQIPSFAIFAFIHQLPRLPPSLTASVQPKEQHTLHFFSVSHTLPCQLMPFNSLLSRLQ